MRRSCEVQELTTSVSNRRNSYEIPLQEQLLKYPSMLTEHEIEFRVRYKETDAMGYLHHANYAVYFEMGRTELLRAQGGNYRAMEESGLFMVVVRLNTHFRAPARYDDLLKLKTRIKRVGAAKLEHEYFLYRDGQLLSQGESVLACVDSSGKVQPIPEAFRGEEV